MGTEKYSFERFLNVRSAYNPTFSPDGQKLCFLTDITGVAEVWSVPVNMQAARPAWPEQLTFRGERNTNVVYSPCADLLLVAGDVGGNERHQLFLLSADGSNCQTLTSRPDVVHLCGSWSPDGTRIVYSSNARDSRFFDVYELTLKTGDTRVLLCSDDTNYVQNYSPDGRYVLVTRMLSNTRNLLLLVETATGEVRNVTP
ncbi:MAG TPA: hypothetical protein VKX46_03105, partial [Ktedonobacteraceae bacterium]|nr:hypothetical protein [Ktedonobacteraceae bacterium]